MRSCPLFSPASKHWRNHIRQTLCRQSAHLWASASFVLHFEALGIRTREGLCIHLAQLWGIAESALRSKVSVTADTERVIQPRRPILCHC